MDVYEVLNRNISDKCNRISPCLFVQEDREKLNENDKLIFDILEKISSLGTIVSNSGVEFRPIFVMANGQRKFAIEDITDDDYKMLKTVDFQRLPLVLRSLLADIFWTQKKEFEAAKIAAEAYWEMFQLCHIDNDGLRTLDMIKRATCISVQTRQESLYSERLTQMVCFDSKEEIRSRVIDKLEKFPLSYLFGRKRINKHGQIVFALPPLDIKNPEKNPRLLELHMYQNELEKQKIIGDTLLKNALAVIRNNFLIKSSIFYLCLKVC